MVKRKQVKNACIHCQKACKKCDDERPCTRCIKYNLAETCTDSPRKERRTKRTVPVHGAARRRRQVTVTEEDDSGDEDAEDGLDDVKQEGQQAKPPVPPLRMHLRIEDPSSIQQQATITGKRPTRRTLSTSVTTNRPRRHQHKQNSSMDDNTQSTDDHYQNQLASLRATYRISKPGNPNYRPIAPAVLPGMEAWDAAAAASTANHTLYMTAQYKTMSAISQAFTMPANVVRSASPIGALAAVCADLHDKPIEFVHALDQDGMKHHLPPQQHYEPPAVLIDASALASLQMAAFPAPIPSRFPTPPETPIHQWVNHALNQQQHTSSTAPGSPVKVSPAMMVTIANAIQRARSTSPLSSGVINNSFSPIDEQSAQPSQLAQPHNYTTM